MPYPPLMSVPCTDKVRKTYDTRLARTLLPIYAKNQGSGNVFSRTRIFVETDGANLLLKHPFKYPISRVFLRFVAEYSARISINKPYRAINSHPFSLDVSASNCNRRSAFATARLPQEDPISTVAAFLRGA